MTRATKMTRTKPVKTAVKAHPAEIVTGSIIKRLEKALIVTGSIYNMIELLG
jgi:hypothetical protein